MLNPMRPFPPGPSLTGAIPNQSNTAQQMDAVPHQDWGGRYRGIPRSGVQAVFIIKFLIMNRLMKYIP
ncbi:MAG: hypothetical protein K0R08_1462 [Solimicrobium sp.]|jgi:hypothetical protein|nr:hypothetical protein [Solimicrobium sp.]